MYVASLNIFESIESKFEFSAFFFVIVGPERSSAPWKAPDRLRKDSPIHNDSVSDLKQKHRDLFRHEPLLDTKIVKYPIGWNSSEPVPTLLFASGKQTMRGDQRFPSEQRQLVAFGARVVHSETILFIHDESGKGVKEHIGSTNC